MIELRQYQIDISKEIDEAIEQNYTKILVTAAPGAGKTILYCRLICTTQAKSAIIVVPSTELKEQIEKELVNFGIQNTEVYTIQKLLYEDTKYVDLLILDEVHRYLAPEWSKVIDIVQATYIFGFTATPFRTDQKPFLEDHGGIFQHWIEGPTISDLTKKGYLAKVVYYTTPIKQIIKRVPLISRETGISGGTFNFTYTEPTDMSEDIIEQYKLHFDKIQTICFCRNIKHSNAVAEDFEDAGIVAKAINGDISNRECNAIIEQFKQDKIQVITCCKKGGTGLNIPNCKVAIFLKSTGSLVSWIQEVGRVLRVNGQIANVVDMVGNVFRNGKVEESEEEGLQRVV